MTTFRASMACPLAPSSTFAAGDVKRLGLTPAQRPIVRAPCRSVIVRASGTSPEDKGQNAQVADRAPRTEGTDARSTRRELLLQSSSIAMLASVFSFGSTRPSFLGYKRSPPSLALCPSTPNCISTSEELNDPGHYVPPWTYNPEDGRGKKNPATQEQAMAELVEVVKSLKPDGFEPTIVEQTDDYLAVEYASSFFGFVDDVEFWFPPGPGSRVEYRSASRSGESDFNVNRKRIKAIRQALEKKGWVSVGF